MVQKVSQNPAVENHDMAGNKITNVQNPSNPQDAATLDDVNTKTAGNSTARQTVLNAHVGHDGLPNMVIEASDTELKTQGNNDLANDLQGYYNFENPDGSVNFTNLVDGSTVTNNGSVTSSSNGIRGKCADFASGGTLSVGNVFSVGSSDFMFSIWVKADSGGSLKVFQTESTSSTTNTWYTYINANDKFGFKALDGGGTVNEVLTSSSYTATEWHNVVYNRSGSSLEIYVDGALDNSGTIHSGDIGNNGDGLLGESTDGFVGLVDETGFWDRTVTNNDILLLYDNPLNVGLKAYYSFEGDLTDELGSNDGTNNGCSFVSGFIGQSVRFDNNSGATFDLPADVIPFSGNPFYFQFWFKPPTVSGSYIIGATFVNDNENQILIIQAQNQIDISIKEKTGAFKDRASSTPSLTAGNSALVKIKSDGVNSIDVAVNDNSYTSMFNLNYDNHTAVRFGGQIDNDSEIDELSFWNRELTLNEQSLLYRNGKGRSYTGLRDLQPLSFNELAFDNTPPHLTFGNGFTKGSQRNFGASLTSPIMWTGLTSNAKNYLYIEYDSSTGTVSTGSNTTAPIYANTQPNKSGLSDDDFWYPVDHRHEGERFNATSQEFERVFRLYVGEVDINSDGTIDNSTLVTYAYQGYVIMNPSSAPDTGSLSFNHHIGTDKILPYFNAIIQNSVHNYSSGDVFDVSGSQNGVYVTLVDRNTARFITHGSTWANFTDANGGPASSDPSWNTDFEIKFEAIRNF